MTLHRPLTVGGDQSFSLLIFRNSLFTAGGNPRGRFALGLVQSEWKVYVKRHLDREEQDIYFLNITATDGLFVTQAMVEVTVSDVNDHTPKFSRPVYSFDIPEDTTPGRWHFEVYFARVTFDYSYTD